jgi:hypothetical protein
MSQRMPVLAVVTSVALIAGVGALAAPAVASPVAASPVAASPSAGSAAAGSAAAGSAAAGSHRAAGGVITTVAGGVGGPGSAIQISLATSTAPSSACSGLSSVAFSAGQLYLADTSVRKVSEQTDQLTTPAGTGSAGPFGAGGPASRATIAACGVAVDHAGNLVIADTFQRRIEVLPHASGTF